MIRIEQFKAEDWYLDDPVEMVECPPNAIDHLVNMGIGFSVFDDEKCLGSGGIIFWAADQGETWIRIDKCVLHHADRYVRAIVEALGIILDIFKGNIFCWVDVKQPIYQRFVRWFGFKKKEELRIKGGKSYRLWEFDSGNSIYDRRDNRKCGRSNAASKDSRVTSESSSTNKSI